MKTKNDIITEIYNTKFIQKVCSKYVTYFPNEDDRDDFEQELYLTLLNMTDEKLQGLYERKELYNYILTVIKNQIVNPKSKYNKKYNNDFIESITRLFPDTDKSNEYMLDKIMYPNKDNESYE